MGLKVIEGEQALTFASRAIKLEQQQPSFSSSHAFTHGISDINERLMNEGLGERNDSSRPGSYAPKSVVNNDAMRLKGMLRGLSLKLETKPDTPRVEARPLDDHTASIDHYASLPDPHKTSTDAATGGLTISNTQELALDDLINTSNDITLAGPSNPPTVHADAQKINDGSRSTLLHMQQSFKQAQAEVQQASNRQ